MNAASLFDGDGQPTTEASIVGMVRHNDVDTSIDAANVVDITCRAGDTETVYRLLDEAGEHGLTDYCLAHLMSTPEVQRKQTSVGKRRGELKDDGIVVRRAVIDPETLQLVQDKRVPIAGSNQRCAVWVLTKHQRSNAG